MAVQRVDDLEAALLAKFLRSQLTVYELLAQPDLINPDWPKLKSAVEVVSEDMASLLRFRSAIYEATLCLEGNRNPPEKGSGEQI